MAVDEERELSDAYRSTKRVRRPEGQGLNDLYIRFFRMAERRIAEKTGRGVVCFISNYSWLDGLSFTGMRERYLDAFDAIRIDCLNGDKYKTGKVAPDGSPDPSIFSTEGDPVGIQVGTAIATLVRKTDHTPAGEVGFRHLWGPAKRAELAETAEAEPDTLYGDRSNPTARYAVRANRRERKLVRLAGPGRPVSRFVSGRQDQPRCIPCRYRRRQAPGARRRLLRSGFEPRGDRTALPHGHEDNGPVPRPLGTRSAAATRRTERGRFLPFCLPALRQPLALLGGGNQAARRKAFELQARVRGKSLAVRCSALQDRLNRAANCRYVTHGVPWSWSAKARRLDWANRYTAKAELGASAAMSKRSSVPMLCATVSPPELRGPMPHARYPRWARQNGKRNCERSRPARAGMSRHSTRLRGAGSGAFLTSATRVTARPDRACGSRPRAR